MTSYSMWMKIRHASDQTIEQRMGFYRSRLADWGTLDVTSARVGEWLSGFDGWTRYTYYAHLVSIYTWATEQGVVADDPMRSLRRPARPRRQPRPLTPEERRRAMAAASGDLLAHLELGLFQGLRAHEIAQIDGQDVTRENLRVRGKGGRVDVLPTHPLVWARAAEYPRSGFWFPSDRTVHGHIVPETVTYRVTQHFRELGIEGSSHRARHAFGTGLLRGGANIRVVQELMRHSSLATTALYLGVDEDEKMAAINGLVA